ncbi:hypothetical protein CTheo_8787 [Ceratobasidium theobromae]|uniref:Uncharacterized protein n=1 Tax=Ceratobasidium theobromae TaxID=1582974 RepID=A0A5N5Q8M5_9AGAM|nr:hypothetical protein CTheo_8787 [Ceratobasidium theobromae]
MPKKSAAQLARERKLAAWRQNQKAIQCGDVLSQPTPFISHPVPDQHTFLLAEPLLSCNNPSSQPSAQHASGGTEPNVTEVDLEDLPFEDPKLEIAGSEDELGASGEDGTWVRDSDMADVDEDFEIRVDSQPIPPDEQVRLINDLEKLVKESFKGKGKLIKGSMVAATAVGRGKWAAESAQGWICQFWRTNTLPPHLHGTWNESVIEDEDLKSAILEYLRCIG